MTTYKSDKMPKLRTRYRIRIPIEIAYTTIMGDEQTRSTHITVEILARTPTQATAKLQVALQQLVSS